MEIIERLKQLGHPSPYLHKHHLDLLDKAVKQLEEDEKAKLSLGATKRRELQGDSKIIQNGELS